MLFSFSFGFLVCCLDLVLRLGLVSYFFFSRGDGLFAVGSLVQMCIVMAIFFFFLAYHGHLGR